MWPLALWNAQRTARATVVLVSLAWHGEWYASEELVRGIELKRSWEHGVIPVYRDGLPTEPLIPSARGGCTTLTFARPA